MLSFIMMIEQLSWGCRSIPVPAAPMLGGAAVDSAGTPNSASDF